MSNDYQAAAVVDVGQAHGWIQGFKFFFFCVLDNEGWMDFADRVMDIDESDEW